MTEERRYYSTHQAAKELGVCPGTILRWIDTKRINIIKTLGGHRRIPKDEIIKIKKRMGFILNR